MNDDTISRQTAIDEFVKRTGIEWEKLKNLENLPSAERHEPITSEMDEIFRIASEIRLAVGCNTSRECWELARKGDIQRVRHGQWIDKYNDGDWHCSACGAIVEKDEQNRHNWYRCYHCGAKMVNEDD